jgi:hypothetical protein
LPAAHHVSVPFQKRGWRIFRRAASAKRTLCLGKINQMVQTKIGPQPRVAAKAQGRLRWSSQPRHLAMLNNVVQQKHFRGAHSQGCTPAIGSVMALRRDARQWARSADSNRSNESLFDHVLAHSMIFRIPSATADAPMESLCRYFGAPRTCDVVSPINRARRPWLGLPRIQEERNIMSKSGPQTEKSPSQLETSKNLAVSAGS